MIAVPVRASGRVDFDPRRMSVVSLRFEGFVESVGKFAEGDYVLEKLHEHERIDTSRVKREGLTSFTAVMADTIGKQRTFYHYRGANARFCEADIDWDNLNADMLHIGYILLLDALLDAEFLKENLTFVEDGEDLMNYLCGRGQYSKMSKTALPDLILLDLNMPKKDGREALKEIKSDPELRKIPVVVLTTSTLSEDVKVSYELGANTYISKPMNFDELVLVMQTIKHYWSDIAVLA